MGICLNWGLHYHLSQSCLPGEVPHSLSLGRRAVTWSICVSYHEELSGMGTQVPRSHSLLQGHPGFAGGAVTMPGCSGPGAVPILPGMGPEQVADTRGSGCLQREQGRQVRHERVAGACPSLPWPVLSPQHTEGLMICLSKFPASPGSVTSLGRALYLSEDTLSMWKAPICEAQNTACFIKVLRNNFACFQEINPKTS